MEKEKYLYELINSLIILSTSVVLLLVVAFIVLLLNMRIRNKAYMGYIAALQAQARQISQLEQELIQQAVAHSDALKIYLDCIHQMNNSVDRHRLLSKGHDKVYEKSLRTLYSQMQEEIKQLAGPVHIQENLHLPLTEIIRSYIQLVNEKSPLQLHYQLSQEEGFDIQYDNDFKIHLFRILHLLGLLSQLSRSTKAALQIQLSMAGMQVNYLDTGANLAQLQPDEQNNMQALLKNLEVAVASFGGSTESAATRQGAIRILLPLQPLFHKAGKTEVQ